MVLAYPEWKDNSASDEPKNCIFWERFLKKTRLFEYFAFFSMWKEVSIAGLAYSESPEKMLTK
jgi:xanthine dehydrogenase molybdopterin-binding subunit B